MESKGEDLKKEIKIKQEKAFSLLDELLDSNDAEVQLKAIEIALKHLVVHKKAPEIGSEDG